MKILLATYGSRGDVQPMLALALGLQARGHEVCLAAPPEQVAWIRQMNCPAAPLGSDLTTFIDNQQRIYSLPAMSASHRFLRQEIPRQFDRLRSLAAGADLAIGSSLVAALATIADALGMSYRYIAFTPQILPSRYHICPLLPYQNLPQLGNRLTWRVAHFLYNISHRRLINHYRYQMGLAPIGDGWRHILGPHLMVASDPAITPIPPDVHAPELTQTGYLHLQQPKRFQPALERFLAAGRPPLLVGFGSMPKWDQMTSLTTIVRAAKQLGERVVIQKRWDDPAPFDSDQGCLFIDPCPHLDLFPHMAAIIHHGGAGTTATAARSGVPQIIVPHLLDQYYWGAQIEQRNLGPPAIPRARLNTGALIRAMEQALSDESIHAKVKRTAAAIRAQDSLANGIDAIMASLTSA